MEQFLPLVSFHLPPSFRELLMRLLRPPYLELQQLFTLPLLLAIMAAGFVCLSPCQLCRAHNYHLHSQASVSFQQAFYPTSILHAVV